MRLSDPEKLAQLVQHGTSRALAQIEGPRWRIALDNPARVEDCRQAAAEAKRKAEAYASSLGTTLGAVLSVTEPGLGGERYGDGVQGMVALAAASHESPALTIEAGDLDVAAAVDVIFRLEKD